MIRWTGEAEIDNGRRWQRFDVIASDVRAAGQAIADAAMIAGATVVIVHNVARTLATYSDGEVG